jgi:hypothetical protein
MTVIFVYRLLNDIRTVVSIINKINLYQLLINLQLNYTTTPAAVNAVLLWITDIANIDDLTENI